jgi:hypothetical protein
MRHIDPDVPVLEFIKPPARERMQRASLAAYTV